MARRKKRHEKEPNHERWLVSYADFITLLFAFFVTMYAISRVDGKKFGSAVESIHRALGSVVPLNMPLGAPGFFGEESQSISPQMTEDDVLLKQQLALGRALRDLERQPGLANVAQGLRVSVDERGLVISFPDSMLFEPCSEKLRPEYLPLLDAVGEHLLKMDSPLRVEGHTDNGACPGWPSNWELSTARASTVIRYLTGRFSFNPARLSAAGYAGFRPVDTNDTGEGRARNRRVDIIVLSGESPPKDADTDQKAQPVATSTRR